jgi:hypothetical protein
MVTMCAVFWIGTAVENTFVQFYPTLFEVAKKMKKVSRPPAAGNGS